MNFSKAQTKGINIKLSIGGVSEKYILLQVSLIDSSNWIALKSNLNI